MNSWHRDFVFATRGRTLQFAVSCAALCQGVGAQKPYYRGLPAERLMERLIELSLYVEEKLKTARRVVTDSLRHCFGGGHSSDLTQAEPSGGGRKGDCVAGRSILGLNLVPPPIPARLNAPSEAEKSKIIRDIYLTPPTPRCNGALAARMPAPNTSQLCGGPGDGCVRGEPEPMLGRFGEIGGFAAIAGMRCRSPREPFFRTVTCP